MDNKYTEFGRIMRKMRTKSISDEALLYVVILGLVASVSDGKPDNIEIQTLRDRLTKLYLKEPKELLPFIQIALKYLNNWEPTRLADSSCQMLKQQLSQSQLLEIFDFISDILVSDGKIEEGEEEYLAKVADNFDLLPVLRSIIPRVNTPSIS